jgi:hypothetical protein
MGDRSKISTYAPLLEFLDQHGVDLSTFGSAERGLAPAAAATFFDLLQQRSIVLLGLEPWRHRGDEFRIDSVLVWRPSSEDSSVDEARHYMQEIRFRPGDVVTVQFR